MKLLPLLTPFLLTSSTLAATVSIPTPTFPSGTIFQPDPGPDLNDLFFRADLTFPAQKTTLLTELSLYNDGYALFYIYASTWDVTCHPYAVFCAIGDFLGNAYTFSARAVVCPAVGGEDGGSAEVADVKWTPGQGPGFNITTVSEVVRDHSAPLHSSQGRLSFYCKAQVGVVDKEVLAKQVLERIEPRNATFAIIDKI